MTECPIKNLYPHSINTDRFPLTEHDIICLFFSHWKRYYQVCMDTSKQYSWLFNFCCVGSPCQWDTVFLQDQLIALSGLPLLPEARPQIPEGDTTDAVQVPDRESKQEEEDCNPSPWNHHLTLTLTLVNNKQSNLHHINLKDHFYLFKFQPGNYTSHFTVHLSGTMVDCKFGKSKNMMGRIFFLSTPSPQHAMGCCLVLLGLFCSCKTSWDHIVMNWHF